MTAKHTPGPWITNGQREVRSATADRPRIICRAHLLGFGFTREEAEANAHLIAACPVMYDYVLARAVGGDKDAIKILQSMK